MLSDHFSTDMQGGALFPVALLLAWLIDLRFGEPRNALHPVAWLGWLLGPVGRRLQGLPSGGALVGGAVCWWMLALGLGGLAWWLQTALMQLAWFWAVPVLGLLLKPCFAWRMLRDEVTWVAEALSTGVQPARERLSRLVSRDVTGFGPIQIRETAIETLAENLNDSVIAPLFWYAVFGLPGAVVYRMANTMDAMWGYRGRWEWAGKWAAVADDVLSWIPARLTALLLRPSLSLGAWRSLALQARRTPSPNGGWPMGAMALRLNVRLSKPEVYVLNETAGPAGAGHLRQALNAAGMAARWGLAGAVLACSWRFL
jgi:adenosylcobinamide-phosphate synthase